MKNLLTAQKLAEVLLKGYVVRQWVRAKSSKGKSQDTRFLSCPLETIIEPTKSCSDSSPPNGLTTRYNESLMCASATPRRYTLDISGGRNTWRETLQRYYVTQSYGRRHAVRITLVTLGIVAVAAPPSDEGALIYNALVSDTLIDLWSTTC